VLWEEQNRRPTLRGRSVHGSRTKTTGNLQAGVGTASSSPPNELLRAMLAAEDVFLGVDQQVPLEMLSPAKCLATVVALPDWSRSE
jgi:hypothetical protein